MVVSIEENLKEALKILRGPREKEYGDKQTNHTNIANLWSVYLDKNINRKSEIVKNSINYFKNTNKDIKSKINIER